MATASDHFTADEVYEAFVGTVRASTFLGPLATASDIRERTRLDLAVQNDVLRAARELGVVPWGGKRKPMHPAGVQYPRVQRIKEIMRQRGW